MIAESAELPGSGRRVITVSGVPEAGADRHLVLRLQGVRHDAESFSMRVFLNLADADHNTPIKDPHYAGSLYMYGHGLAANLAVHPKQHRDGDKTVITLGPLEPFDTLLDINLPYRYLLSHGECLDSITLVPVAEDGSVLGSGHFRFDSLRLSAE